MPPPPPFRRFPGPTRLDDDDGPPPPLSLSLSLERLAIECDGAARGLASRIATRNEAQTFAYDRFRGEVYRDDVSHKDLVS